MKIGVNPRIKDKVVVNNVVNVLPVFGSCFC